ncbi:MAG: hydroxyquinol 1,2-dioxygenase [Ilumatobacteraceae bacterium]
MTSTDSAVQASQPNAEGYREFTLGGFHFRRDEFFVRITWPTGMHVLSADVFLRALQRDVAWDFFYGTVNFDQVFGTVNHYGTVDMFAGRFNEAYRKNELDHTENFDSPVIRETFKAMLDDWTNASFDPFASPAETEKPFGVKDGSNTEAITRRRVAAARMVGVPGDEQIRTDATHPVNRMFADVDQSEPEVHAEPGFEGEVAAFNLFAYLSRSDVTWNPSVVSVCKNSLYCPTTEEYILPVVHGNDRVEWFVQLSDEIVWDVQHRDTGAARAKVTMRAGDVAAMPGDIRHQGYSAKRSMLLVWENGSPELPELIRTGKASVYAVDF